MPRTPIAASLSAYLDARAIDYSVVHHRPARGSQATAATSHVAGAQVAKGVLVTADSRLYCLALPAPRRVHLGRLGQALGVRCALATTTRVRAVFDDCDSDSIPAVGQAYGLPVLLDVALAPCDPVYLESGRSHTLLALSGRHFRELMRETVEGDFSERTDSHARRP